MTDRHGQFCKWSHVANVLEVFGASWALEENWLCLGSLSPKDFHNSFC
jgi:hypothetical protein